MKTHSAQRICVLGAGIVGLATAWTLAEQGHKVVVVDRQGPGEGTSQANGAQLSYAHVQPLANPSVWRQLPRLLTPPLLQAQGLACLPAKATPAATADPLPLSAVASARKRR